jgi:hypothetical protein
MFISGPTFSLFSSLSAKTDADFPITNAKNQILRLKKPIGAYLEKMILQKFV